MKFEVVSKYKNAGIALPERKTAQSAGYDIACAQDIVIPPMWDHLHNIENKSEKGMVYTLDEMAKLTKILKAKPTLVPTGIKCKIDEGCYLELSVRSSSPLKYWLVLANGVGIIDADYYNNPDNEGELFFQLINMTTQPIQLKKGDIIGQGILKPYYVTDDDVAFGERMGGFGSTSENE